MVDWRRSRCAGLMPMGTSAFRIGMLDSFIIRSLCAAFGGEAVFLQAAIGFVGNGAFDEGGGEGGFEVASFKVFAPAQGQCCLDFLPGHIFFHDGKQAFQLFTDLPCDWCRGSFIHKVVKTAFG